MSDVGKPNTMRGILSIISAVFDPLNFACPVTLNRLAFRYWGVLRILHDFEVIIDLCIFSLAYWSNHRNFCCFVLLRAQVNRSKPVLSGGVFGRVMLAFESPEILDFCEFSSLFFAFGSYLLGIIKPGGSRELTCRKNSSRCNTS